MENHGNRIYAQHARAKKMRAHIFWAFKNLHPTPAMKKKTNAKCVTYLRTIIAWRKERKRKKGPGWNGEDQPWATKTGKREKERISKKREKRSSVHLTPPSDNCSKRIRLKQRPDKMGFLNRTRSVNVEINFWEHPHIASLVSRFPITVLLSVYLNLRM